MAEVVTVRVTFREVDPAQVPDVVLFMEDLQDHIMDLGWVIRVECSLET